MKYEGLILDMDGTMLDSERMHTKSFTEYLKIMAGADAENKPEEVIGLDFVEICENNVRKYGIDCSVEEYVAGQQRHTRDYFMRTELKETEGLTDFLKGNKENGIKIAVASSSPLDMIRMIMQRLGVLDYLDALCGDEDVKRTKPEPDAFLVAAEKLNIAPEKCIAFEDSLQGIVAAGRAGMKVIAVTRWTSLNSGYEKADAVIRDFREAQDSILSI